MLWPPDAAYASRGQELRAELGVTDDSALRSRALRNHFEHLDERIEGWEGGHALFDLNIGSEAALLATVAGAKSSDVFRHFDPDEPKWFSLGNALSFVP
jgi:hypothetical protein